MFDDILVYVPEKRELVVISEGAGDNLLSEDIEEGYRDYVYYENTPIEDAITNRNFEYDGGMVLYKEIIQEKFSSLRECIGDVLDMAYGNRNLRYQIL